MAREAKPRRGRGEARVPAPEKETERNWGVSPGSMPDGPTKGGAGVAKPGCPRLKGASSG